MAKAPGFRQEIPLPYGRLGELLRDPLGFQLQAHRQYGDIVRFRNGPIVIHFLYHPDHVRRVLFDHSKLYVRSWQYRLVQREFGENLVVTEGASWLRRRRMAQPAFQRETVAEYARIMIDTISGFLDQWQPQPGQPSDAGSQMMRLALAIAGRALFSRDVSQASDTVGSEFAIVGKWLDRRFNHPFTSPPAWLPTSANRRFRTARRILNQVVLTMIRERRRDRGDRGDLLSMLMQARDEETGQPMTDEQISGEVLTFLIAGHETTATALTWTWYLLARHHPIRQQLRQEIQDVLGDRPPVAADVGRLNGARMVIQEALRLYPPVWIVSREAVQEDEIRGFRIPKRSMVLLSPFVTHRHPEFWEEPETFRPERFAADRAAALHRGAYFPFLTGPHHCIGSEFAMMEMILVVAMLLQRFDVRLPPSQEVHPKPSLTLRPAGPIWLDWQPAGLKAGRETCP